MADERWAPGALRTDLCAPLDRPRAACGRARCGARRERLRLRWRACATVAPPRARARPRPAPVSSAHITAFEVCAVRSQRPNHWRSSEECAARRERARETSRRVHQKRKQSEAGETAGGRCGRATLRPRDAAAAPGGVGGGVAGEGVADRAPAAASPPAGQCWPRSTGRAARSRSPARAAAAAGADARRAMDAPVAAAPPAKRPAWERLTRRVLRLTMEHSACLAFFNDPVDVSELPGYAEVVKDPICLSEIGALPSLPRNSVRAMAGVAHRMCEHRARPCARARMHKYMPRLHVPLALPRPPVLS